MNFQEYVQSLKTAIIQNKTFNVKFFIIDDDTQRKVEAAINMIFERYGDPDLPGVIYTCVKEVIINGTKANLKRILFEKNKLNIDNETEYLKGMMDFRNVLNNHSYQSYLGDLINADFWVNIRFEYSEDGVRMTIVNNAHITAIEERRMREKLKKAMGYEDIAQFYMDQGDEIEGAGMGIALIIMLLKGVDIDPSLFRIGNTQEDRTFSRLEIPVTDEYISMRKSKRGL